MELGEWNGGRIIENSDNRGSDNRGSTVFLVSLFEHRVISQSHYRWYVPRLEVLLGGRNVPKDASYLPRFGVSVTLQEV